MSAPDRRTARANSLFAACEEFASLAIPAHAPHREALIKRAAFGQALQSLLDVGAQHADPVSAFCVVLVQRGFEAGVDYAQTFATLIDAFDRATAAHVATMQGAAQAAANAPQGVTIEKAKP